MCVYNLVVHELLLILKTEFPGLYGQGYADDICHLARGYDLPTVRSMTQRVMNRELEWCRKVDLGVNPDKVVAVLFTKNRKWKFRPLRLAGKEISIQNEAKYLGVVLDSKLNWNAYCNP